MSDEALTAVERVILKHPTTSSWGVWEVAGTIARNTAEWHRLMPSRELRRQHPADGVGRIIVTPAEAD